MYLELGHHPPLGIVRHAATLDESLAEMVLVVSLEDVLVRQEPEQRDRLVENDINLLLGFLVR
jgi:hypothetical protein